MNGKTFEVGTDVNQISPPPSAQELQEITFVAFAYAKSLPEAQRVEMGRYMGQLSKGLLEKEGK